MRTSNNANRPAHLEQLAPEAAAVICKELNAREFAKLGEPRTWFDLQGAAAYLVVSEQTLSCYVKSRLKDGVGFDLLPNHKNAFPQPNRMDAQSTGEAVMIDRTRVVGDLLFATHRERAWYLGRSNIEQRRWLLENPGRWWRIEDLQQEDAARRSPVEGDVNVRARPASNDRR